MFIFLYIYTYIYIYIYICTYLSCIPICTYALCNFLSLCAQERVVCRASVGNECPQTPPRAFPRRPSQALKGHITCPTC